MPGGAVLMRGARVDLGLRDRAVAIVLAPVVLVVLAVVCPLMLLVQGRPIFFVSERMRTRHQAFHLLKLRTMVPDAGGAHGVLGGHASARVTALGHVLRVTRIDEFPQLWNVLRGDIRLIGPRPPLRRYVEAYPELYARVLRQRPGITGLATVRFHAREAQLLKRCQSAKATDDVYRRHCIRHKARLDLFYQRRRSLGLDALILYWTVSRLVPPRKRRRADAVPSALAHRPREVI